MGRTARHRRKKTLSSRASSNLGSDRHFIDLAQWMSKNGWSPTCRLAPADFMTTGRGLRACEYLPADQTLVSIPLSMLITTTTVNASDIGWIFKQSRRFSFSTPLVLSAFLLWEKSKTQSSFWFSYLQTIPKHFSSATFCSDDEITRLPTILSKQIIPYNESIFKSYQLLKRVVELTQDCPMTYQRLMELFNFEEFLWAWFAVNTRCIYVQTSQDSIPISDKDCMALAPYLDMFNHSNQADIDTRVNGDNFEIRSRIPFQKHSQVFIKYGSHSNLTLFLEYGFVLPNNEFDVIKLTLEELLDSARAMNYHSSSAKHLFLRSHDLHTDLYIDNHGLGFRASAVVFVLTSTPAEMNGAGFGRSVFASSFSEERGDRVKAVVRVLLGEKRSEYQRALTVMRDERECSGSFQVARDLLQGYVDMLGRVAVIHGITD